MSYDNTNRGQFWKNDKKQTDTHPDWTGSINIEGVEYWLSGWSRKPGGNPKSPSVSMSFQRKDQVHNQGVNKAKGFIDNGPGALDMSAQTINQQAHDQTAGQYTSGHPAPGFKPQKSPAPEMDSFDDDIPFN